MKKQMTLAPIDGDKVSFKSFSLSGSVGGNDLQNKLKAAILKKVSEESLFKKKHGPWPIK